MMTKKELTEIQEKITQLLDGTYWSDDIETLDEELNIPFKIDEDYLNSIDLFVCETCGLITLDQSHDSTDGDYFCDECDIANF